MVTRSVSSERLSTKDRQAPVNIFSPLINDTHHPQIRYPLSIYNADESGGKVVTSLDDTVMDEIVWLHTPCKLRLSQVMKNKVRRTKRLDGCTLISSTIRTLTMVSMPRLLPVAHMLMSFQLLLYLKRMQTVNRGIGQRNNHACTHFICAPDDNVKPTRTFG